MNDKNWSIHVEFAVLLVTLIGGFYTLDGKIERQGQRTDRLYEIWCETEKKHYEIWCETQQEIKQNSEKNYQMWVETQNEIKQISEKNNQMWVETQREIMQLRLDQAKHG